MLWAIKQSGTQSLAASKNLPDVGMVKVYPKCVLMAANVDRVVTLTRMSTCGDCMWVAMSRKPLLVCEVFSPAGFSCNYVCFWRHTAPSLHYARFCRKHFSTLWYLLPFVCLPAWQHQMQLYRWLVHLPLISLIYWSWWPLHLWWHFLLQPCAWGSWWVIFYYSLSVVTALVGPQGVWLVTAVDVWRLCFCLWEGCCVCAHLQFCLRCTKLAVDMAIKQGCSWLSWTEKWREVWHLFLHFAL